MKFALLLPLVALAGAAAGQTPAPDAKPQTGAEKPRPVLKLNLDEVDQPSRPTVIFGKPEEAKKNDAAKNLPGLGGPMTRDWERPSSQIFPPNGDVGPVQK